MTVERFPVEATHIMTFARAIGDPNPVYAEADDPATTAVGGILAPPTFMGAAMQFDPDNPLRPRLGEPWFGSAREPSGVAREDGTGGLHAEQHFEYHRPLRPGDVLTATQRDGATWQKESKRAGTLSFSESVTEYRDATSGELVITARAVGVQTGKPVERG